MPSSRPRAATSLTPLRAIPDPRIVLDADRPGVSLLHTSASSDGGRWQYLLPWPDETRALPWERASEWKSFIAELEQDLDDTASLALPFEGGWVGFVAYEAMAAEEAVRSRLDAPAEPAAFFTRHAAGVAISPAGEAFLFAPEGTADSYVARLQQFPASRKLARTTVPLHDSLDHGAHAKAVEQIRASIREGDVYQVNLTRAFSAETPCDPAELYRTLIGSDPPEASAFLRGDGWTIVSASPEILLEFHRSSGVACSRPIKGTIRRNGHDKAEIAALLASAKDAAEHLMIVDVVRNDFGKIAPAGRVSVSEYRAVRSLEHVHHLESTVRAEGLRGMGVATILGALSPAASITGAPKRTAVRMIRELEPEPRGVYCGSIGFIAAGAAQLSVAIRTAVVTDTSVRYHAGGGIVWDSNAAAEDDECRAKAAAFLHFLGLEV